MLALPSWRARNSKISKGITWIEQPRSQTNEGDLLVANSNRQQLRVSESVVSEAWRENPLFHQLLVLSQITTTHSKFLILYLCKLADRLGSLEMIWETIEAEACAGRDREELFDATVFLGRVLQLGQSLLFL